MSTIPPIIFQEVRSIQMIANRLANDILAGAYHSAFKGMGMEFEDVREYQPGDEERRIDWNVTARMNHPYVKNFREERELTVILIVDISASCRFGSTNRLKKEIIAEISALFAFSAIKNNDKVGLILFSDTVEKYLPPKKGVKHVLRVIRELLFFESKGKGSNIKEALSFFGKIQHRSAVCFLLSDFICPDYSWEASLLAKRHDLISIAVTDPCEIKFPALNLVNLSDLETGEIRTIDTSSPEVQTQFQEMATQRLTFHRDLMTRIGAGFIDIRTNQSYLPPLRKFFKMREKKR